MTDKVLSVQRVEEICNAPDIASRGDMWEFHDSHETLRAKLKTAEATNKRLNRRCQEYESGLAEKLDKVPSGTLGRALANAAATKYKAELETAEAENERLLKNNNEYCMTIEKWQLINARMEKKYRALREVVKEVETAIFIWFQEDELPLGQNQRLQAMGHVLKAALDAIEKGEE